MSHKSGFVNIIGSPNVGKSTLMNQLVGEKLSIITSKMQTTRHRIMGMVNEDEYQIVFSDTPGIINPAYRLHQNMMKFVSEALNDADVILMVTDIYEDPNKMEDRLVQINNIKVPTLLLLNKIDLSNQDSLEKIVNLWKSKLPKAQILPISALHQMSIQFILPKILEWLPENPPYFDKDQLTNKSMRFFVSEIIREKILIIYQKEVPYSCEVVVEEYKDEEKIVRIRANIMVSRTSQKAIVIGHQGKKIKKLGTDARLDIESFISKKVYLELYVKVDKDWRDKEGKLKKYGY
ncbi:MAG: GTPase Era [Flavobacteriales bacterium]|jgi:GTPase|tara:strand:- start:5178 stop:6053 length:876 start_codon:yes stop_codon:yes gene_type:complete